MLQPGSTLAGATIANRGTLSGQGRIDNAIALTGTLRASGGTLVLGGVFDMQPGSSLSVAPASTLQFSGSVLQLTGAARLKVALPLPPCAVQ